MTLSTTVTQTFTRTHAKHLASKVISDLYQCHCYYGQPSETSILEYQEELVVMLLHGFVSAYEFGFEQNDRRVVCWQYRVSSSGDLVGGSDDSSGGIYARAEVSGACYFNFMTYSEAWSDLTSAEQSAVLAQHDVHRTTGELPLDGYGYWETDRRYGSGGVVLERRAFRPL
jgi:Bacterial HORMA domain family 1